MAASGPIALPVQALDHAKGYLMAAAVLNALHRSQIVKFTGKSSVQGCPWPEPLSCCAHFQRDPVTELLTSQKNLISCAHLNALIRVW